MAKSPKPQRRILIIDDEPFVCESIRMVLSLDGHEVETVTSGQAALKLFSPGKFDLVITDYFMPEMKGDELAVALKARAPRLPIIMISGYANGLSSRRRPLFDVDCLLCKPFGAETLRQAIVRFLP